MLQILEDFDVNIHQIADEFVSRKAEQWFMKSGFLQVYLLAATLRAETMPGQCGHPC